ncbi:MAG: flagellar hook protein [Oscillospiraceae bacterium]|jgi:flagellin|nr:flagellar hook protein [Oscillospiraceae bacterium]
MAGMIVQHNLNAINANNKLGVNVLGTKKSTEKLSSGFRINRAADDAAGLAISEKMRAQIRGLSQAVRNANDGISLIQTAEGALDETHAMLKRLKELAVQAGNETYSDEERSYMQMEIETIKTEVDRIAKATDFNGIKLLDGSLGGGGSLAGDYGARYGIAVTTMTSPLYGAKLSTSQEGIEVTFTTDASGVGGENAFWDSDGKLLTVNLSAGTAYTQAQIDTLIKNANYEKGTEQSGIPDVKLTLGSGVLTISAGVSTGATVAGQRANASASLTPYLVDPTFGTEFYADTIAFISNNYGADARTFTIATDVGAGKEWVEGAAETNPMVKNGQYILHLSTGKEYSAQDLQNILAKAGFDYTVVLGNGKDTGMTSGGTLIPPDGDYKFFANRKLTSGGTGVDKLELADGAGLGKDGSGGGGNGITFQIGANNAVEQRVTLSVEAMDASSIGIANISVRTLRDAQDAMDRVNTGIIAVSSQRAALGAMQNRLEHTINSLTVSVENITSSEAQIRDTDMATEMVEYTKYSILQQAAQAMLAQANQAPQAILQLLR